MKMKTVIAIAMMMMMASCSASLSWQLPIESAYAEAETAMSLLCSRCKPSLMQTSSVNGAAIVQFSDQQFLIVYNSSQMKRIATTYGRPAVVWIFAHELGHMRDMLGGLDSTELSADMHGGCLLALMGESMGPARELLQQEAIVDEDHPPASERISAVADGYNTCSKMWKDR